MILKLENAAIGEVPPIELPNMSIVVGIEESGIYLVCVTTLKVRIVVVHVIVVELLLKFYLDTNI